MSQEIDKKKGEIINARVVTGAYGSIPGQINDGVVERIIEPPEGGTFLKFIGCSYFYKGDPDKNVVYMLGFPKRRVINFIRFANTKLGKFLIVILFPFKKQVLMAICESFFKDMQVEGLNKCMIIGEKGYCVSVREIWRVITAFIAKEKNERIQNIAFKLRNIALAIIEYDIAYKFVLQDILPEIDKEKLKKNAIKELQRVYDIFCERSEDVKLRQIFKTGILFLRISKSARKIAVDFFLELDCNKIKMDEADWYFCLGKGYYNFKDIALEKRLMLRKQIDRQKKHFIPEVKILNRIT